MKQFIKNLLPEQMWAELSLKYQAYKRANITDPIGILDPMKGEKTFVMIVGATFDQRFPNAMMTARMGYCHGFEEIGIPYIILDVHSVKEILPQLPNPICMLYAADLVGVSDSIIRIIRKYPSGIWVQPWFKDSKNFFQRNGLDYRVWTLNEKLVNTIISFEAKFGFTATVSSGLYYFEEWQQNGLPMASLPLACDTKIYRGVENLLNNDYKNVQLAFVGGYWKSKGLQIDSYLRPLEDKLTIYGYSKWPYKGYSGLLSFEKEPQLYYQAKICPVINEPSVALMKGQINERVFKVLGSNGCPIVDAVPAYTELYSEDELLIAQNVEHFHFLVKSLLDNEEMNNSYRKRGKKATLSRHTYAHRATEFIKLCK